MGESSVVVVCGWDYEADRPSGSRSWMWRDGRWTRPMELTVDYSNEVGSTYVLGSVTLRPLVRNGVARLTWAAPDGSPLKLDYEQAWWRYREKPGVLTIEVGGTT